MTQRRQSLDKPTRALILLLGPGGKRAGRRDCEEAASTGQLATALSLVWYPASTSCAAGFLVYIEPLLKVMLPAIGLLDELLPPVPLFDPTTGALIHSSIHVYQHVSMYVSVLLCGLLDMFIARTPALALLDGSGSCLLGVDGIALVAAFASQALILVFHLTGPSLDIRLHSLLVLASAITAACIAASLAAPRSAVLAYLRCISLLALGSFWIQTGDLSYKRPAFDTNEGVAIAPLLLLVHYAAWGVALLFFFAAVALPKPEDASGSGDSAGEGAMSMRRRHRSEPPRHKGVDVDSAVPLSDAAYAAS